ncbi:hypothetical protein QJS10_CPB11g00535 [Acorus calamus]|uniref:Uncharacterized protein n=1 Tax=Acorus calamus TaxID=4465 RepID=A0AAV9DWV4_ACOCL|nr:hypothetical protein QJS10_CPB11g00535 [Acorus calamus]
MGMGSTVQGPSSSSSTLSPFAPPFTVGRTVARPRLSTSHFFDEPYNLTRPTSTADTWVHLRPKEAPATADPVDGGGGGSVGYGGFESYSRALGSATAPWDGGVSMSEPYYYPVSSVEGDDVFGASARDGASMGSDNVNSSAWKGRYFVDRGAMDGGDGDSSAWKDRLGHSVSSSNYKGPLLHVHYSSKYTNPAQSFPLQTSVTSSSVVTGATKWVKPSIQSVEAYGNREWFDQSSVRIKDIPLQQGKEGYFGSSRISNDMKSSDNYCIDFPLKKYAFSSSHKSVSAISDTDSLVPNSSSPKPLTPQFEVGHVPEVNPELMISQFTFPNTPLTLAPSVPSSTDTKSSPEVSDQCNLSVDSPCWKGAQASQNSPFEVCEAVAPPMASEFSGYNCSIQGHIALPSSICSEAFSSHEPSGDKKEKNYPDNHDTDFMLSNESKSGSDPETVDAACPGQTRSNASSCAYHMSATTTSEPNVVSDTKSKCSTQSGKSELLVKAVHHLSELLLSICNNDSNALKGQEYDILHSALDNFNACVSPAMGEPEPHLTCYHRGSSGTCKAIKDVMTKSFRDEGGDPYKNLWIEAEVSLCLMKYQLQLAQMEMRQRCKECRAKDVMERPANITESSIFLPACDMFGDDPSVCNAKEVTPNSVSTEAAHAAERLYKNPLETIDRSDNYPSEDVDSSVMARFKLLKSRMDNLHSTTPDHQKMRDSNETVGLSEMTSPWPFNTSEPVQRENYCDQISLDSGYFS